MIGKIARSGSDFLGALSYCKFDRRGKNEVPESKERGELIYHQLIDAFLIEDDPDLNGIAAELSRGASLNSRTKKPVCHVSLSFPPGEHPPREVLRSIVLDFAEEFGFIDNSLLAYLHLDKPHQHLHIIANKIDANGKNTFRSSFNYLSMGHFCRKMEYRYGLQKVKQMDALKIDGKENKKESQHHDRLRSLIDDLLPQAHTLRQLQVNLLKKGYKSIVGNGITFIHASSGVKIKGSELGRGYSRQNLEKRINGCYESEERRNKKSVKLSEIQKLRELIQRLVPQSCDFNEFVRKLNQEGYGVITRQKIHPKSGKPFTKLFFTKEFTRRETDQQTPLPKILSGYQLGPEFRYSVILKNLNQSRWEWNETHPHFVEPSPFLPPETQSSLGLNSLLTSTNASRVEADTGRSHTRSFGASSRPDPDLEGRSEEEKRAEKQKMRKNRYPRPRM